MLQVPFALNIMSGADLWGSFRDPRTGQWLPQGLISRATVSAPSDKILVFSMGAVVPSQAPARYFLFQRTTGPLIFTIGINPDAATALPARYSFAINGNVYAYPVGPFPFGDGLFAFLRETIGVGKSTFAAVASFDGGETWATQDSVNSPSLSDSTIPHVVNATFSNPFWDGVSKYVYFLNQPPADGTAATWVVNLLRFNMDTKAWETLHTGINEFTGLAGTPEPLRLWVRIVTYADGTPGILYMIQPNGAPVDMWYREFSGGALTPEVNIRANPYTPIVAIINPYVVPNRIEVFAISNLVTNQIVYLQVNQGSTFSADIFSFPLPVGLTDGANYGIVDPNSRLLVFGYDDKADGANAVWETEIDAPNSFIKFLLPVPDPAIDPGPPSCQMVFFGELLYNGVTVRGPINLPDPRINCDPQGDFSLACRGLLRCGRITNLKVPVYARRR